MSIIFDFMRGLIATVVFIPITIIWFIIGGMIHIGRGESPYELFNDLEWLASKLIPPKDDYGR